MNERTALRHISWRAGYGLTVDEWHDPSSVETYLGQLFVTRSTDPRTGAGTPAPVRVGMLDDSVVDMRRIDSGTLRDLRGTWLQMLAFPGESGLREKMAMFWHGHFACHTILPGFARQHMRTLRALSLGSFRELVLAISRDAAMLNYLNNQQNRKGHPNENFARELMELFTIGLGNYTEKDVQEAARAFTGWTTNLNGDFEFREEQHDSGLKTFMGHTGALGGEDIIDIILARRESARFVAGKIYRYFVNPTIDEAQVASLASHFYESSYDISGLMRYLFKQDWFYDERNIGARIKSPVDLVAGLIRLLDIRTIEKQALHRLMSQLGQVLFAPPSVAGWAGHRHWINNATLPLRLTLPSIIFSRQSPIHDNTSDLTGHFYLSPRRFEKHIAGMSHDALKALLVNTPVHAHRISSDNRLRQAIALMGSLNFQMC